MAARRAAGGSIHECHLHRSSGCCGLRARRSNRDRCRHDAPFVNTWAASRYGPISITVVVVRTMALFTSGTSCSPTFTTRLAERLLRIGTPQNESHLGMKTRYAAEAVIKNECIARIARPMVPPSLAITQRRWGRGTRNPAQRSRRDQFGHEEAGF